MQFFVFKMHKIHKDNSQPPVATKKLINRSAAVDSGSRQPLTKALEMSSFTQSLDRFRGVKI